MSSKPIHCVPALALGMLALGLLSTQPPGGNVNAWGSEAAGRPGAHAPRAGRPELSLTDSVSQHGVTWRFQEKVRVGRFVGGDYYVVGPVTVISISPPPQNGATARC